MPHFYIENTDLHNDSIIISNKELLNHLVKARRVKSGEKILFFDKEQNEYLSEIIQITKNELKANIIKKYKSHRILDFNVSVAKCVLKSEADFSSIQKATELGVKRIIPVISDNCAVNSKIIFSKSKKFQKIADESVKQCERADFPIVETPSSLEDILKRKDFDTKIVFSERETNQTIKKFFRSHKYNNQSIILIIGPEGGFSDREFELFEKYNIPQLTLGKLIMRADTALTSAIYGVIQEISNE